MLKFIIAGLAGLIVAAAIFTGCITNSSSERRNGNEENAENEATFRVFQPGELIDFQLYNSYTIDTRGLRELFRVVEGTPFVFFEQSFSINRHNWDNMFDPFRDTEPRIEYDDFNFNFDDFSDNYFIITIGRELVEIRVVGMSQSPHRPHEVEVAITFAEEYQDGVMFIYTMDRIRFPFAGVSSEFYIMEGSERVFKGNSIFDLMEPHPTPSLRR